MFLMNSRVTNFAVKNIKRGKIKLSDGSEIIHRVAIVDVRPTKVGRPSEVEFGIDIITGISVYPSKAVLSDIKSARIISLGEIPPDEGWETLEIVTKENSFEEITCNIENIGEFLIRVEIDPAMASINKKVRTVNKEPFYVIKWIPKFSWKKLRK